MSEVAYAHVLGDMLWIAGCRFGQSAFFEKFGNDIFYIFRVDASIFDQVVVGMG